MSMYKNEGFRSPEVSMPRLQSPRPEWAKKLDNGNDASYEKDAENAENCHA